MRLWTIHPSYLDAKGLVALWREALLARAVLRGETVGYRHHPQLERFREHSAPRSAINAYLAAVLDESRSRGYAFDASKVKPMRRGDRIELAATTGQVSHEWTHLLAKLEVRSPELFVRLRGVEAPKAHPLFRVTPGARSAWEKS